MILFVLFTLVVQPVQLRGSGDLPLKGGPVRAWVGGLGRRSSALRPPHATTSYVLSTTYGAHPAACACTWYITGSSASKKAMQLLKEFMLDVRQVLRQRTWVMTCMAYTLYVAVLGVYAYWGPQAGKALFFGVDDTSSTPDLVFGGVTVLTGVVGSLMGGFLLDRLGSSIRNSCFLCALGSVVGFVLVVAAFLCTRSFAAFMAVFAMGQLAIFLLQVGGAGRFLWLGASMRELAQLYHCRVDCSLVITITRQGRIFFSIGFVCVCMAEKRI